MLIKLLKIKLVNLIPKEASFLSLPQRRATSIMRVTRRKREKKQKMGNFLLF